MIVACPHGCGMFFDDEFRTTVCPHGTFAANDGKNNFSHYPASYIGTTRPDPAPEQRAVVLAVELNTLIRDGRAADCVGHIEAFAAAARAEWAAAQELRAALTRLVDAKDEKDQNGDSERYRALKAGAWEAARLALLNDALR